MSILFHIYINDIVNDKECDIKPFADNTSISLAVDNYYEAAEKPNKDIKKDVKSSGLSIIGHVWWFK